MIEREPVINAVRAGIYFQRLRQVFELPQYGAMSKSHALLQSGSACRMLNKCQGFRRMFERRDFNLSGDRFAIAGTQHRGLVVERYIAEQFVGKSFVDHDEFGGQVCSYSGQSGAVLGRLNLEVGVGEECGHRSQHHRTHESSHRGNALRHDEDHAVALGHVFVAQHTGLKSCTPTELGESNGFTLVFVDPRGDKRAIRRGRIQCLNKIAKLVHAAVIVSGENEGPSVTISQARNIDSRDPIQSGFPG